MGVAEEETANGHRFEDGVQSRDRHGRAARHRIGHHRGTRGHDAGDEASSNATNRSILRAMVPPLTACNVGCCTHPPPAARRSASSSARQTILTDFTSRLCNRDHGAADTRVGGVLDDPVAGLERRIRAEQQRCGRRIDPEHRQLVQVSLRQSKQPRRRNDCALAPCPAEHCHELLVVRLAEGIKAGDLPPDTDIAPLAEVFETVLRGMAVRARDGADQYMLLKTGRRQCRPGRSAPPAHSVRPGLAAAAPEWRRRGLASGRPGRAIPRSAAPRVRCWMSAG